MLSDQQISELLKPHAEAAALGPHPRGYCSVPFRAIPAEHHARVTAWVERDGLGHRAFHMVRRDDTSPSAWRQASEQFWVIPRARLALT
jgi:hypothetical protein